MTPLGAHNPRVRALRALLRDASVRREARRYVAEGPRLLMAALDANAPIDAVFVAPGVPAALLERTAAAGIEVVPLAAGVADRVSDAVTSQGVITALTMPDPAVGATALATADFVVVAEQVNDPGNAGALWRGGAAAGARVIVLGAGSADAYNPKLVRATAGACFHVPVAGGVDVASVLADLGTRGVLRAGATARGGVAIDEVDLTGPVVVVVGHEARGLADDLPLDVRFTIPMAAGAESLNLAMAATVASFEVARQRRGAQR